MKPSAAKAIVATLAVLFSCSAQAAGADGTGHLFPGEKKTLYVIGASFADNVATGMRWVLRDDPTVKVGIETKPATGLVRRDVYDWQKVVTELTEERDIDVAVVALGGNDRQQMYADGKRLDRFSLLWRVEYLKRVEAFMKQLASKVDRIYWVGLPVVRSTRMSEDFARLNSYFEEVGKPLGIRFIDIRDRFARDDGSYSAYGLDSNGNRRNLRNGDGIHFNMTGAKTLAAFIVEKMRQDLRAGNGASVSSQLRETMAK